MLSITLIPHYLLQCGRDVPHPEMVYFSMFLSFGRSCDCFDLWNTAEVNAVLVIPGAALSCSWFIVAAFALCSLSPCSLLEPSSVQFSSVQSLSRVWLFATPWTAARQASLSMSNSWSLPKLIESVMPSNHLILCCPLLLLPSIPPSIRVFSSESALRMRWPKYWSFSFNISPSSEHSGCAWKTWVKATWKALCRCLVPGPAHLPHLGCPAQLSFLITAPLTFFLIWFIKKTLFSQDSFFFFLIVAQYHGFLNDLLVKKKKSTWHRFDPWVAKIPPEKEMTTDSIILAWEIPWTEWPGRLQPWGLKRVRRDSVTDHACAARRPLTTTAWEIQGRTTQLNPANL